MSRKQTLAELQAYLDSDYIPPANQPQPQPNQPTQPHLFDNLNWQTECEPPIPNTQLYHLLTVTQQVLIGYYPETHSLDQPNPHYIAWAPLSEAATASSPLLWS